MGFFYILGNKPGRLSFGTQEDFDSEDEEGYSPIRIPEDTARGMAIDGDELGDPDNGGRWSVHLYAYDAVPSWFSWCIKRQGIVDAMRPQLEEIEEIDETLAHFHKAAPSTPLRICWICGYAAMMGVNGPVGLCSNHHQKRR